MEAKQTTPFATRVSDEDAERLDTIRRATDWTKADTLRRAVQFYLNEDPDNILSPDPLESVEHLMDSMGCTDE